FLLPLQPCRPPFTREPKATRPASSDARPRASSKWDRPTISHSRTDAAGWSAVRPRELSRPERAVGWTKAHERLCKFAPPTLRLCPPRRNALACFIDLNGRAEQVNTRSEADA